MENYSLSQEVGRGKYSVVYKGRKKQSTEYRAIKSVDKERRARVINEVSILQELSHLNVLKVYHWYETTNHLWLVMELCTGGDLLTLLTQDTRLPECSIMLFARDLLAALQYTHSKGVVYCDLKPSTILIDGGGNLKLADFGLAKRVTSASNSSTTSNSEQKPQQERRGTPFYMAPELFQDGVHSFASDLYSLGCVLYELASGNPPFVESSISSLMQAVLSNPYPPIPNVSAQLNDLLSGLLRKEPSDRLSWRALLDHSFWDFRLEPLPLPRQPQYEAVLLRRKQNQHLGRTESVIRMSRNAQRNLKHEEQDDEYASKAVGNTDVMLSNTNMELDFADEQDLRRAVESPTEGYDVEDLEEGTESEPPPTPSTATNSNPLERRVTSANDMRTVRPKEPTNGGNKLVSAGSFKSRPVTAPIESEQDTTDTKELMRAKLKTSSGGDTDRSERGDRTDRSDRGDRTDRGERGDRSDRGDRTDRSDRGDKSDRGGDKSDRGERGDRSDRSDRRATTAEKPTTAPAPLPPLSSLMWHASDIQIQPIIHNKKIEVAEEHTFNPKSLPFPTYTLPQVLSMSTQDLQNFLGLIYKTLSSKSTIAHKLNALAYFETLCVDSQSANMLINSPMLGLMVRQLKSTKSNSMRSRLALLIGLLIRWATEINQPEISKTGLMDVLATQLRDRTDEKVRRRLMAAFGELLFYAATQEGEGVQAWAIPPIILTTLVKFAQHEDEVVKHYATKALENIASHSSKYATKIISGNKDIGTILLATLTSNPKNESLKATAASGLARLSRHSPALINNLLDKHGTKLITQPLSGPGISTRLQLAYLNLLNITLLSDAPPKIVKELTSDQGLITDLIGFLDHGMTILRAKALVALCTLSRLSYRCLLWACSFKLLPALERIEREKEQEQKDSYLKQCCQALTDEIMTIIKTITNQIASDLRSVLAGIANQDSRSVAFKKILTSPTLKLLKEDASYFPIVLHVVASVVYRLRAFATSTIVDLAESLTHTGHLLSVLQCDPTPPLPPDLDSTTVANLTTELEEFHHNLIIVLEGLSQNATVLLEQHDVVVSHLLPALLGQLAADSGDVRLVCLRAFIDITTHYITQPELYESPMAPPSSPSSNLSKLSLNSSENEICRISTKKINDLIEKLLLPRYSEILNDADPIPIFGLKLLNIILERNPTFITTVNKLNLTQKFFDFFQLDNPNNNITNIKLIKKLVESPDIDKKVLFQNGIVNKLTSILTYSYENNVDQFFEPLLDIMYLLLRYAYHFPQKPSHTQEQYQTLLQGLRGLGQVGMAGVVASMLSSAAELDHAPVVERCSRIAYLTTYLFPSPQVKDAILTNLSDEAIIACFTEDYNGGCSRSAAEYVAKLLLLVHPSNSQTSAPPTNTLYDKHVVRLKSIDGLSNRLKQLCISSKDNIVVSKLSAEVWKLYFSQ